MRAAGVGCVGHVWWVGRTDSGVWTSGDNTEGRDRVLGFVATHSCRKYFNMFQ